MTRYFRYESDEECSITYGVSSIRFIEDDNIIILTENDIYTV